MKIIFRILLWIIVSAITVVLVFASGITSAAHILYGSKRRGRM